MGKLFRFELYLINSDPEEKFVHSLICLLSRNSHQL